MIMVDKKNRSLVLSLSQQQSSNNNHGSIAIGSINDTTNIANTNNTINSNDYIANTSNNISNPKSSSSNNSSNNATNKANNNQSVKRKRLTQACDVCRKKKVKCSGEKPSCNNCTRLNLNCTYLPSPRKRGPRVGLVESLERRLQQMEKLLQPLKEQGIVVGGPNNNKNFNQEQQQQQQQQQQLQQLQFISQDPNSNNNVSKSNNDFVPSQINLRSPPSSSSSSAYNNNNNNDQEFINAFSNSQPQLNNINNNINNINNNNNSLQSPLQRPPSPSSSSSSSSTTSSPLIESNELKTEIKEEDDVLIYFGKTSAKPGFIPKKETICGDADDNDIMHTTTTNSSENSSESSGSSNNNSIENSPNININNYNYILNNNNVSMPMTKTILFRPSLDMDTVEHLASCYFRYIDNQMPLLHKSTFMTQLRQNKVSPFLIYSLCAVAARFSDRQDIVRNPRYLSGEGYAEIASQMIFHTIDRPSPEAVQALLLLTMQSYGAMKGPRCWTYLGIAIRMAQEIGLHRIDESLANSSHSVVDDEMAFIKKETRRRTFWLGFTLDRFSACALGRPHMIQESDCDVRLPCKEEIWNLEHPFTSPKIDEFRKESKEKQGLLLKLAKCGLCACLVSVAALLGRACQYVNRSNSRNISQPWDPKSEYVQLEDDIKSWHSSISPHYDYSFEKLQKYMSNGTGVSFATMHIVYHATVVVLNRHSFSRSQQNDGVTPDVEFVKKSDAKCTEAARFASEIAKDIISIGCSNMFPFSVYGVFATASIHINDSFSNDKELAQNAKKYLKIDEQYLRDMESHWATAGKLATLMKEMIIAKESNNKSDITPFYNYNNNESNGIYDNNNNIYNNFGGLGNDNIGIINNMVPMSLLSPRLLFSDQTFINGGGESWTSLLRSPYILTPRTLQRITNNNNNNNNNNNANNNNNSDMSGGGIDYFTQNSNVFGSQYPTITYENVPLIDASSSSTTGFIPPEFSSTNANTTRFPPLM